LRRVGLAWYAVVAALLYGAHQIFTRMAADHIGEALGGFVVEATDALSILLYLAFLELLGRWNQQSSAQGIFYSVLAGNLRWRLKNYIFPAFSKKAAHSP
jgi:bacterial/archaeal transporter family protein